MGSSFATTPAVELLRRLGEAHFLDASQRPFPERAAGGELGPTSVLINGCGRSGTHAIVALLRRHGILAQHEGRGRDNITIGWPYIGRSPDWNRIWPMRFQPEGEDAHSAIFKVHRHPLSTVHSIANGFTTSGFCRMSNPSERRWESRAWNCATKFVPLPVTPTAIAERTTCKLNRRQRLRLALHYWVKWNLLGDRWATHSFQIENVTVADIARRWCEHCTQVSTCPFGSNLSRAFNFHLSSSDLQAINQESTSSQSAVSQQSVTSQSAVSQSVSHFI